MLLTTELETTHQAVRRAGRTLDTALLSVQDMDPGLRLALALLDDLSQRHGGDGALARDLSAVRRTVQAVYDQGANVAVKIEDACRPLLAAAREVDDLMHLARRRDEQAEVDELTIIHLNSEVVALSDENAALREQLRHT